MSKNTGLQEVIDYIETHLDGEIDVAAMAHITELSVYEFRRIFSFVAGIPLGEYIRKRRLSAAAELAVKGLSVTQAAAKYGYDSPSSFTRAFKEFHGFAPGDAAGRPIKIFTKIGFTIRHTGGAGIPCRFLTDTAYTVCGTGGLSDLNDTDCCEAIWNRFYQCADTEEILSRCGGRIYAVYQNRADAVACTIGWRGEAPADAQTGVLPAELETAHISAGLWACFPMRGADDTVVNRFYGDVLYRWLVSCGYEREPALPNIEVFPQDMEAPDFPWEIRIPLKKSKKA